MILVYNGCNLKNTVKDDLLLQRKGWHKITTRQIQDDQRLQWYKMTKDYNDTRCRHKSTAKWHFENNLNGKPIQKQPKNNKSSSTVTNGNAKKGKRRKMTETKKGEHVNMGKNSRSICSHDIYTVLF